MSDLSDPIRTSDNRFIRKAMKRPLLEKDYELNLRGNGVIKKIINQCIYWLWHMQNS